MHGLRRDISALLAAVCLALSLAPAAVAQGERIYHRIEGRLQARTLNVRNIRVRLLRLPEMRPLTETFSRPEGQFTFGQLSSGDYVIETVETDDFEATYTTVAVHPPNPAAPTAQTVNIIVHLSLKPIELGPPPGTVPADVDTDVPKDAAKRFRAGMKAVGDNKSERAVAEFRAAIELYPKYYAARLELGRELRLQKQFGEAEAALRPLVEVAPKHAEPRIELGIVLLSLGKREQAADQLREAVRLKETNWAAHLYLGWALLETDSAQAAGHFQRALVLDEPKAARAHLALARLAQEKGDRSRAVHHLDSYLQLAPEAGDAEAARKLADSLRSPQ